MQWIADECVSAQIVARMRQAGHDVVYVAEAAAGTDDAEVVRRSRDEQRITVTDDKDSVIWLSAAAGRLRALCYCEPGPN